MSDSNNLNNINFKKLKFISRRGMLELDLVLNKYLDNNFDNMSEDLKLQYEELMEQSDQYLYNTIILNKTDILQSVHQTIINNIINKVKND